MTKFSENFMKLAAVNVAPYIMLQHPKELKYLPWPACHYLMIKHTDSYSYEYIENPEPIPGLSRYVFPMGNDTGSVRVAVTVDGIRMEEELPILDTVKNRALKYPDLTSGVVNKALKRCYVKACALHGLGLNLYVGSIRPFADGKEFHIDFQPEDYVDEETGEVFVPANPVLESRPVPISTPVPAPRAVEPKHAPVPKAAPKAAPAPAMPKPAAPRPVPAAKPAPANAGTAPVTPMAKPAVSAAAPVKGPAPMAAPSMTIEEAMGYVGNNADISMMYGKPYHVLVLGLDGKGVKSVEHSKRLLGTIANLNAGKDSEAARVILDGIMKGAVTVKTAAA